MGPGARVAGECAVGVRHALTALAALVVGCAPPRETAPPLGVAPPPTPAPASSPAEALPRAPPAAVASAAEEASSAPLPAPPCEAWREHEAPVRVEEPGGPRKSFSWHGYVGRRIAVSPDQCVVVAWPPGDETSEGKPIAVAKHVTDAWLRAIENTLARLPPRHAALVSRVVIDNRPTEHGIAAFDRGAPDDGRDGHTIWLHERLFTERNHWARGNYGAYWSYHASEDGVVIATQPREHGLFSPVLLHEIGHLVSYALASGARMREEVPPCAAVCGDRPGGCRGLSDAAREDGCISAYCTPFKYETGTENWAEHFRLFFQSALTRRLLTQAKSPCAAELEKLADGVKAPWENGLPDMATFHRSRWKSCGERACKPF